MANTASVQIQEVLPNIIPFNASSDEEYEQYQLLSLFRALTNTEQRKRKNNRIPTNKSLNLRPPLGESEGIRIQTSLRYLDVVHHKYLKTDKELASQFKLGLFAATKLPINYKQPNNVKDVLSSLFQNSKLKTDKSARRDPRIEVLNTFTCFTKEAFKEVFQEEKNNILFLLREGFEIQKVYLDRTFINDSKTIYSFNIEDVVMMEDLTPGFKSKFNIE